MKSKLKHLTRHGPGATIGAIALVVALAGTAVAAANLKLANFEPTSRDRLAGTGVIQYAQQPHTTPGTVASFNAVNAYSVKCELDKKASSGGFKWTGATPDATDFRILDSYPNGSGYVVRLLLRPDDPATPANEGTALNKPLSVYANCVKSRLQRGTPPA